jgi:hypothetical protein
VAARKRDGAQALVAGISTAEVKQLQNFCCKPVPLPLGKFDKPACSYYKGQQGTV